MRITLPVSGKEVEIKTYTHAVGKALRQKISELARLPAEDYLQGVDQFRAERDAAIEPLYAGMDLDAMPHRDVVALFNVTHSYSMGEPVAAIKNSLAGGDGALTASEPTTAPTAEESAEDAATSYSAKDASTKPRASGQKTGKS